MKNIFKLSLLSLFLNLSYALACEEMCCGDECCETGVCFDHMFCENFTVAGFKDALKKQEVKSLESDLDGEGLTQLMCAAYNKDLTMAEELIKAGANVNAENICGKSVLMLAAKVNSNPEMIKLLLKNGANINDTSNKEHCPYSEYDLSALTWATWRNQNPEVAITLIEAGADVNVGSTGTGLYFINWEANKWDKETKLKVIKRILKAGTKFSEGNYRSYQYRELWQIADKETAELLLKAGIEPNTAFIEATQGGNLEIMDFLIKAGADVNSKNENELTALMFASNAETVNFLIKNDFKDINAKEANEGRTALMRAKNAEVAKALIDAGADVNLTDNSGNTALLNYLNAYGIDDKFAVIKTILEAKPNNVDAQKNNSWNALMLIIRNSNNNFSTSQIAELTKLIIAQKPKLYLSTNDKWTVLHLAARYQNAEIVNLLVKANADLEQKTKDGYTPLMLAVFNEHNSVEVAKSLLNAGANPNAKDNNGKTALELAKENKNFELATALLEMRNEQ